MFIFCAQSFAEHSSPLLKVDFDKSMGVDDTGRYSLMLRDGKRSDKYMNFFRDLYNQNFLPTASSDSVMIPKIIHQIWIGPRPLPSLYAEYAKTCQDLNPGWKYKLWTNDDVKNILSEYPQYVNLFNEYNKNIGYPGQKDILAYLILYKHGGVYFDADVKCIRNFDSFAYNYDFFSALEPANDWSKIPIMTAAIIGSKKNNKIFIDTLNNAIDVYSNMYTQNNTYLKGLFRRIFNQRPVIKIPDSRFTLMMPLGDNLVMNNNLYNNRAIVFPATYFNPIMPPININGIKRFLYWIGYYKNRNSTFKEIKPETIAVQDFYD